MNSITSDQADLIERGSHSPLHEMPSHCEPTSVPSREGQGHSSQPGQDQASSSGTHHHHHHQDSTQDIIVAATSNMEESPTIIERDAQLSMPEDSATDSPLNNPNNLTNQSGSRSLIFLQPPIQRVPKDAESICTAQSELYNVRNASLNRDAQPPCWWKRHKIKENWRPMLAAFGLLVVGLFCIAMGIAILIMPEMGFQSYVFFIAGIICFIPGAYHVVFVICAIQGRKGYDFSQLPLFN